MIMMSMMTTSCQSIAINYYEELYIGDAKGCMIESRMLPEANFAHLWYQSVTKRMPLVPILSILSTGQSFMT